MKVEKGDIYAGIVLLVATFVVFWKVFVHPTWLISPGYDLVGAYTPWKFFLHQSFWATGQIPLWYPLIYSGTPFLGNLSVSMFFYPFNWLFILLPPEIAFSYIFMFHVFFAGLAMYLLLRFKGVSSYGALVAGLCFMFSATLLAKMFDGSMTELISTAWVPAVFLGFELFWKRRTLGWAVVFGVVLGVFFTTGMIRNFFYTSVALCLYVGYRLYSSREEGVWSHARTVGLLALAFGLFLVLITPILLPGLELAQYSHRKLFASLEFSMYGSFGPQKLITLALPRFFGSLITNTEWGDGGWWEMAVFIGCAGLALAVIGIVWMRSRDNKGYLVAGLFALLLAMGKYTPFFYLLFCLVPGFSLFRIAGGAAYLMSFVLVVFTGYGVDYLLFAADKKRLRLITAGLVIVGCISLLCVPALLSQKERIVGTGRNMLLGSHIMQSPDAKPLAYYETQFLTIVYQIVWDGVRFGIALLGLAGLGYLLLRGVSRRKVAIALVVLVTIEMVSFALPYVQLKDPAEVFVGNELLDFLGNDTGLYRVFDLAGYLPHHEAARHNISLVTGYDPMILANYLEYTNIIANISGHFSPTELAISYDRDLTIDTIASRELLSLLNCKYIISGVPSNGSAYRLVYYSPNFTRVVQYGGTEYVNVTRPLYVYENLDVMPRAFVVGKAKVIKGNEDSISYLGSPGFDPRAQVVLSEEPVGGLSNQGNFTEATVVTYTPNRVVIHANLSEPGYLVLADTWYPRWRAKDNGAWTKIYRADYALRAVYLEMGDHTVEFIYWLGV